MGKRTSVRQAILDMQYLASSSHLQEVCDDENDSVVPVRKQKSTSRLANNDSCSEDDSDSSYTKYLDNAKYVKSRGSHRIMQYSFEEFNPNLKLSHQSLMSQLDQHYQYEGLQRKPVFPLDSEEDVQLVPGMKPLLAARNIIKNSDIFDTGVEDDSKEDAVVKVCDQKSVEPTKVGPTKENKKNIRCLSKYLDFMSMVDLMPGDSVSAIDRIEDICDTMKEMSSRSCISKLGIDSDLLISTPQSDNFPVKNMYTEEEDDVLSSLLCTQMLPDTRLMDTLAGTRNILRSEECRKVMCREGKRGGRFYHYLAKYGFNPNVTSVTKVCNTFC